MLELLLEKLQEGGIYSLAELARHFDVSQFQMEQMVQHLARLGYLNCKTACDAANHCPGCSSASACRLKAPAQLWSLARQYQPDGEF